MSRLINWLFSKTKIGKLVDGHKTELGFALWLLGYVIEGLSYAVTIFPAVGFLVEAKVALVALNAQVAEFIKQLGLSVMVVGVGHKAIKENVPAAAKTN